MAMEVWLAFCVACVAILLVPGPTVMIVVSYAVSRGRSSGWATVPGVALGDFVAMTASLLGAGAVLAASATLFSLLKLVGAAYLIWLGVKLWRAPPHLDEAPALAARGEWAMFRNAFVVTALNPKSIVFFIAFVPQFIDPAAPALAQFAVLEATFVGLAALNAALWALLAGELRARARNPTTLRIVNRVGAGFLVGAGLLTAAARRAA